MIVDCNVIVKHFFQRHLIQFEFIMLNIFTPIMKVQDCGYLINPDLYLFKDKCNQPSQSLLQ